MSQNPAIAVRDWALAGEPFRLRAVNIHAADWPRWLPAAAQERAARFTDPQAAARAGAAEWFKTDWLAQELGLPRVEWQTAEHGKPHLTGAAAGWGFNLSHAGDYVVAALVKDAAIGVDLESMTRPAEIGLLARRVFSPAEQELVRAGGREVFFTLWSQKEALLKALGCGWADGRLVRRTQLTVAAQQVEPVTGLTIWSRRVLRGAYALAVAMAR